MATSRVIKKAEPKAADEYGSTEISAYVKAIFETFKQARLIFEPNITFMKSSRSDHPEAVDRVLAAIAGNSDLAGRLTEFTKTSSLLTVPVTAEPLVIQADIDRYRDQGRLVDATAGNSQLIWTFQSQVASRLGDWLQGKARLADVAGWADQNRSLSAP